MRAKKNKICSKGKHAIPLRGLIETHMSLNRIASSEEAKSLVKELVEKTHEGLYKPQDKAIAAMGAVVADLLTLIDGHPDSYCYRSVRNDSFNGCGFGRVVAINALKSLEKRGYLTWERGAKKSTHKSYKDDKASQFVVTPLFKERAKAHGITANQIGRHFSPNYKKPIGDAVRLRGSREGDWHKRPKRGRKLPVVWTHPKVIESKTKINELNRFLDGFDITAFTGGSRVKCHRSLFRAFSQGGKAGYNYDKGGRIYSDGESYQSMSKADRSSIEINGDPTGEIDIRACQTVIAHAKEGMRLDPDIDPYDGIGIDRAIAKACVMQIMGNGKIPPKWSMEAVADYAEKNEGRCLRCDYPFEKVIEAVLKHFPLFKKWEDVGITCHDLQYLDSEIMLEILIVLVGKGVPALPIHDSLIIRVEDMKIAEDVMSTVFENKTGVKPYIKRC